MHRQHSEPPHLPGCSRILIVEDDDTIASMLADELTRAGYDVHLVQDGARALACVRHHRPDAIVLDLMLPVVIGWDFIERYRDVNEGQLIPIIVVSATDAIPRSVYAIGVRRFIPKPFVIDEVVRAVKQL